MYEEMLINAVKLATAAEIINGALIEVLTDEIITTANPTEIPYSIIRFIVEESK